MDLPNLIHRLRSLAPLYLVAIAAGWACSWLGVPLAWMMGPLLATAAFSLLRGARPLPIWPRSFGQAVIASAIGINLTPAAMAYLAGSAVSMVASGVAVTLACAAIAALLVRLSGVDKATALFATLPGGPAEMALLAEKHGGRAGLAAFLQTLRIAMIVTVIPSLMLLGGFRPGGALQAQAASDPWRLALVLAIGLVSALVVQRLRMINAFFMGPLIGVGLATLAGAPVTPMPWPLMVLAQFALGTSIGAMFTRETFGYARSFVPHAVWTALLLIASGFGVGFTFALMTGQQPALLMLANSPGGATEMAVLAKTLGLDAAVVTAYHLVRLLMVVPAAELLFRLFCYATRRL